LRFGLALGRIRVIVEGAEHVRDEPGVIVASNHLSIMDPILVCATIERLVKRRVRYMAKGEAFAWPVLGALMTAYGGFGVRRGRPDRDAYRMAREVLASGDWLGLAPEGTRSRTGSLGEPKQGVALLAVRTGAPILPVGISGTERLWPVGGRFPRPGTTVTIRFGSVIRDAHGTSDARPDREAVGAETEDLMRRIAALLPARYRGRFG
jgi:1-acyl-sn-glycerol-3-phosphate acyltransferase